MIGRIRGTLIVKQAPNLMIDVNGVGYELLASMNTFYHLPELSQEATLLTHLVVREDAQQLYAFADQQEKSLFQQLIKINGIGPKVALSILSSVTATEFIRCIQQRDSAKLVKIPGIGKKTAERLIIEIQDKFKDAMASQAPTESVALAPDILREVNPIDDAINALVALGYKNQDAQRAVMKVKQDDLKSEQLIRLALQGIAA